MVRKRAQKLGDLERAVLEVLWGLSPLQRATVRDVHTALSADRAIAYTTVMTVLERLARKDLVDQHRDGRAYSYRAAATRGEMTAEMMRATLDDFGSGDSPAALVAFVEDATAAEVAALREALARLGR
ncbi:BlaI/MecI/CopY family transcriptional regulator [Nocardioides sp. zg-536]|uniref:BlaI/MecI/CopY family transcriptional regulator n=1 Tax=Nocardioides faecalis TaxID=2803858 RepID=A0A938Y9T8_9ACTN|nr:BlaI/MecI/CopY family transcriptional regulator [Nocardioides faecalis]MBM9460086.1 BlaI/MecI/CopY family transcriptional regulator [Nocardioides faecalis]MBS4754185.1 BlaI/MecI/CopY family transcriptional regulator [Nocardioides faecalis]QVI60117.1 BlaI/MecI/CopY family transcriptional regulator [Nocardioides faecalis]